MSVSTLATLRTAAQNRADMLGSAFVTTALWNEWLNSELSQLYERLASAGGASADRYTLTTTLTISSGNTVSLPAGFYVARKLEYQFGGRYEPMGRATLGETSQAYEQHGQRRSYLIMGGQLHVQPELSAVGTYRLWYVPEFTPLTLDADTFSAPHNWADVAVLGAAIRALKREESDPSGLAAERQELLAHIATMSASRDASGPTHVTESWNAFD